MELDVNALQLLEEREPETALYPCTYTCTQQSADVCTTFSWSAQ
ncbi:ALQxL family class IV lanthipeptide [Micromonospora sp. CPCC 205546]